MITRSPLAGISIERTPNRKHCKHQARQYIDVLEFDHDTAMRARFRRRPRSSNLVP